MLYIERYPFISHDASTCIALFKAVLAFAIAHPHLIPKTARECNAI